MVDLVPIPQRSFQWGPKIKANFEALNAAKTEAADVQVIADAAAEAKFVEVVANPNDSAVAALVETPGSATATALNSTYASQISAEAGDDTARLTDWLASPSPLGVKRLVGDFTISGTLVPPAGARLDLTGASITLAAASDVAMFNISADDVTVIGGILDGGRAGQTINTSSAFVVTGDGVTLDGVQIRAFSHYGVHALGVNDLRLLNLNITDVRYMGVFVQDNGVAMSGVEVVGCVVDRAAEDPATVVEGGIKLRGSSANALTRSIVRGNRVYMPLSPSYEAAIAIEVWFAPSTIVADNHTRGGYMGLSIVACPSAAVSVNTVHDAKQYAIELGGCLQASATGNTVVGSELTVIGIALTAGNSINSNFTSVVGNTVVGCVSRGIYCLGSDWVSVTGNTVSGSMTYLIDLSAVDGAAVAGNVLNGLSVTRKALMLNSCTRVTVTGNSFLNCTQHGVLMYSTNASFVLSSITITGNMFSSVNSAIARDLTGGATTGTLVTSRANAGLVTDTLNYATNLIVSYGSDSPEGVLTAGVGSVYHRSGGGALTTLYVKETGTGNTGWVAK